MNSAYTRDSLSVHFSGHFPGEPGLAGVYWSQGWKWWEQP